MTDLDTLLRNADPARDITVPTTGSPHAERIWARVMDPMAHRPRRQHVRWFAVPVGLAAVLAIALVVVEVGPSPLGEQSISAAAALRQLAVVASTQPALTLSGGQYLHMQYEASILANWNSVGTTATPGATATFGATIDQWSNLSTLTCSQETLGAATFASPSGETAWADARLTVQPDPASSSSCSIGGTVSSVNREPSGAVNVAGLPVDPKRLAVELTRGTTGITRIDRPLQPLTGEDAAFQRAVLLLIEPTVGATPQFWSALLEAMSTFPGVTLLGSQTTHTGVTGLAFAGSNDSAQTVVILSPSTGALLEARNLSVFSFQSVLSPNLQTAFLPTADKSEGGGGYAGFVWLDPVGSPNVVSAVPSQFGQLPPVPSATIYVTMKAGTTQDQVSALMRTAGSLSGGPGTGIGGVDTMQLTLAGSSPGQVAAVVAALKASSIVTSVKVVTS